MKWRARQTLRIKKKVDLYSARKPGENEKVRALRISRTTLRWSHKFISNNFVALV